MVTKPFNRKARGPITNITLNVFQLHGVDDKGSPVFRKRVTRAKLAETIVVNLPACTIVMEACSSANYWCRKFACFGHVTKLISPQFVKPFVKGNKNDRNTVRQFVKQHHTLQCFLYHLSL